MKEVKIITGSFLKSATPNIHEEHKRSEETYDQYFKRIGYFIIYKSHNRIDEVLKFESKIY